MYQKRPLTLVIIISLLVAALLAACGGDTANFQPTSEPAGQEVSLPVVAGGGEEEAGSSQDAAAPAGLQTFKIIPAESRASYLVDEEFLEDALAKLGIQAGAQDVVGSTQVVEGELQLNPETLELGENSFSVDLSTLESDQDRRDNWIRDNGPTFNRFPQATFTATSLSGLPDSYNEGEEIQFQVAGDLTIHEVTLPVTFDARAKLDGDTLAGVLTTRRLMSDFGIEPPSFVNTLTVADEFGIQVEFTAAKQ